MGNIPQFRTSAFSFMFASSGLKTLKGPEVNSLRLSCLFEYVKKFWTIDIDKNGSIKKFLEFVIVNRARV